VAYHGDGRSEKQGGADAPQDAKGEKKLRIL
jgi:hypothetical protein